MVNERWRWFTEKITELIDAGIEEVLSDYTAILEEVKDYLLSEIEDEEDVSRESIIDMMKVPYGKLEKLFSPLVDVGRTIGGLLESVPDIPGLERFTMRKIGERMIEIIENTRETESSLDSEMKSMMMDAFEGEIDQDIEEMLDGVDIEIGTRDEVVKTGITLYDEFIGSPLLDETENTGGGVGPYSTNDNDDHYDKYGLIFTGKGEDAHALEADSNYFKELLEDRGYEVYNDSIHFGHKSDEIERTFSEFGEMLSNDPDENKIAILFAGHGSKDGYFLPVQGEDFISWDRLSEHIDEATLDEDEEPLYEVMHTVVASCHSRLATENFTESDPYNRIVITIADKDESAYMTLPPYERGIFLRHYTDFLAGDWIEEFKVTFMQSLTGMLMVGAVTAGMIIFGLVLPYALISTLAWSLTWSTMSALETSINGGEDTTIYQAAQYANGFTEWGANGFYLRSSTPRIYNLNLAEKTKF